LLYEAWVLLFTESLGIDITKKQLKNVGVLFLHGKTEQTKWFYYVAAMEKYVFEHSSVSDSDTVYRDTLLWLKRFRTVV